MESTTTTPGRSSGMGAATRAASRPRRTRPGGAGGLGRVERLDGVPDDHAGTLLEDGSFDHVHVRLREHAEARALHPEPLRRERHLPRRLLARDHEAALAEVPHYLPAERAPADARRAAAAASRA